MTPNILPLGLATVVGVMLCQDRQAPAKASTEDVLAKLERNLTPGLDVFSSLGDDPRLVPALNKAFRREIQREAKLRLAVALVWRGDPSGEARTYLRKKAADAIQASGPDPFSYAADGAALSVFHPDFIAWARTQGRSPAEQLQAEMTNSLEIESLALAKDPGSKDILQRGLKLGYLTSLTCAKGLALLESKEDIEPIMAIALRQRSEISRVTFLEALAFYGTEEARNRIARLLEERADAGLLTRYKNAVASRDARQAQPISPGAR